LKSNHNIYKIVVDACNKARIYSFIEKQPETFNTMVGERGLRLSGGEKQRISIARCFLRNPKIIVFDEATSALDSITEKEIQSAMAELDNLTSITIAHRLSTIKNVDKILVFENGKIIECGNHDELMNKNGKYFQLWTVQEKLKQNENI